MVVNNDFNNDFSDLRMKLFDYTKKALEDSFSEDFFIIQAINEVNDLNKLINNLSKRLREWSNPFAPRLSLVKDHELFLKELLKKEVPDDFGVLFSDEDLLFLKKNVTQVLSLYELRDSLLSYIESKLKKLAPNLLAVAGLSVSAELLKLAGSLKRLALLPASTIQLLGAETSLFRHLRNKKNRPPKHGIIFNHYLMSRVPVKDRGRLARALADKISMAVKIDYFKGSFVGDRLLKDLEDRFLNKH